MYAFFFWASVITSIIIVILAELNLIHKKYSYTALFIITFFAFIIAYINGFTLKQIGIISPTISDILVYTSVTLFCCIAIYVLNKNWFEHKKNHNSTEVEVRKFLFYTIISVTVQ